MNIPSLGSPTAGKLDERPLQVSTQQSPAAPAVGVGGKPQSASETSRDDLAAAVKKINESIPASAQSLEFSIDEDSKEIVVKIIDRSTREVVRQIPSAEALEIAKSLDRMRGLLIRQTA